MRCWDVHGSLRQVMLHLQLLQPFLLQTSGWEKKKIHLCLDYVYCHSVRLMRGDTAHTSPGNASYGSK